MFVVIGVYRLSAPAVIDDGVRQGFDLATDIGVQRDIYAGWNGQQTCFDKSRMGREGPGGLGYGGDEMAGQFVCGNTFSYVSAHTDALASSQSNIVSGSSTAVEAGMLTLAHYTCVERRLRRDSALKRTMHTLLWHTRPLPPTCSRS